MITKDQLTEFLAQYGVVLPDFMLDAIICQLDTVSACVDGNYDACTATLIYAYAGAIIAGSAGTRRIASQHAPSGASQSFNYGTMDFTQLRRTLKSLDSSGCTTDLVGPDPVQGNYFRVIGGC